MASKYVIGAIKKEMASITRHWQPGYSPLRVCESGPDTRKAPALALGTGAFFTRTLQQWKRTDRTCSAGRPVLAVSDKHFFPLSQLPGAIPERRGTSLFEGFEENNSNKMIWTIYMSSPLASA